RMSREHGDPFSFRRFRAPDCASWTEAEFGQTLADNIDIPDMFRGYGERIEDGATPREALDGIIHEEGANQFYSFFDTAVKTPQLAALGDTSAQVASREASLAGDTSQLISDARYVGSSLALLAIDEKAVEIVGHNPLSRDVSSIIQFENTLNSALHLD